MCGTCQRAPINGRQTSGIERRYVPDLCPYSGDAAGSGCVDLPIPARADRCVDHASPGVEALCRDPGGDLGAAGEPELGQDVVDVAFGGALGDDKAVRNVLVAPTLGNEEGDLTLPAGQRR